MKNRETIPPEVRKLLADLYRSHLVENDIKISATDQEEIVDAVADEIRDLLKEIVAKSAFHAALQEHRSIALFWGMLRYSRTRLMPFPKANGQMGAWARSDVIALVSCIFGLFSIVLAVLAIVVSLIQNR